MDQWAVLGCRRDPRPHPPVLTDPWEAVCSALKSASVRFAAENGRSVALVIDGAEFLTRSEDFVQKLVGYAKVSPAEEYDCAGRNCSVAGALWCLNVVPALLRSEATRLTSRNLPSRAQTWADEKCIRIVFVSSPGKFLKIMRGSAAFQYYPLSLVQMRASPTRAAQPLAGGAADLA